MVARRKGAVIAAILLGCCLAWSCRSLAAGRDGPGDHFRLMDFQTGGFQRCYRLHIPPGYHPGEPIPLVIALHGAFSSGKQMARRTGLNRLADRENFMVLYPEGIGLFGFLQHWNAGHCCSKAKRDHIDDLGFIGAALGEVATEVRVDRKRLYLLGYSNGGMMAHRLAAAVPGDFAAVAVVAGTVGSRSRDGEPYLTTPPAPGGVPILIIHGREDDHVPYEGGRPTGSHRAISFTSVRESAESWVRNNHAGPISITRTSDGYTRQVWPGYGGAAPVEVITLEGWGHDWPGPERQLKTDVSSGVDALGLIWRFFRQHRRP